MSCYKIPESYTIWSFHPSKLVHPSLYPNFYWGLNVTGGILILWNYRIKAIGQCARDKCERPAPERLERWSWNLSSIVSFNTQILKPMCPNPPPWLLLGFLRTASRFCPVATLESNCSLFGDWHLVLPVFWLAWSLYHSVHPAMSPTIKW